MKDRLHVLQDEQETNIDSFNKVLTETSKTLLGTEKTERRMDKNKDMENNRRKKRNKEEDKRHQITADKGTTTDQIYSILDKYVKRKTKADNRAFIDNLADEAETTAQMQMQIWI